MSFMRNVNVYISTENTGSGIQTGSQDVPTAAQWLKTSAMADFLISPLANNGEGALVSWSQSDPGNESAGTCSATPLYTIDGIDVKPQVNTKKVDVFGQQISPEIELSRMEYEITLPLIEDSDWPWDQLRQYAQNGVTGSGAGALNNDAQNVTTQSGFRLYTAVPSTTDDQGTGSGCHWNTYKHCRVKNVETTYNSEETNKISVTLIGYGLTASDRPYVIPDTEVE